MIFGMPTLLELNGIQENVDLCQELGLDFVELSMNLPEFQSGAINVLEFLELAKKNDVFYTIHLPEVFDIAEFNDDLRKAQYSVFQKTVELGKQLEVPIINMHMSLGIYFTLPNEKVYLYKKYKDLYLKRIAYFSQEVSRLLDGTNILLAVENTGCFEIDFIIEAVDLLLKNKHIVLTWDIGHDHSSKNKDLDFITSRKDRLGHMHIHDAIGSNNHLTLFSGEIDLIDRLRIAKEQDVRCVIETKTVTALRESVMKLKDKGYIKMI